MEEKNEFVDVVLTPENKVVEKKIFGQDASQVENLTKKYVEKADDRLAETGAHSQEQFWDTIHSGTKKLVEERPDLCKLI